MDGNGCWLGLPSKAWLEVRHKTISETPDTAFQWLTDHFDSFGKPYAMVETNDTAERLSSMIESSGQSGRGLVRRLERQSADPTENAH